MKQYNLRPYLKEIWGEGYPNRQWICPICDKDHNKEVWAIRVDTYQGRKKEYKRNMTYQDYACSERCGQTYILQDM